MRRGDDGSGGAIEIAQLADLPLFSKGDALTLGHELLEKARRSPCENFLPNEW
jgi:hypothetical protein